MNGVLKPPTRRRDGTILRAVDGRSARVRKSKSNSLPESAVCQLARLLGIQTSYQSMDGKEQRASPRTLKALFRLWGIDAETNSQIREAFDQQKEERWRQMLEPVHVSWDGKPTAVSLRIPTQDETDRFYCMLHLADGSCRSLDVRPADLPTEASERVRGTSYCLKKLRVPALPMGYHHLTLEWGNKKASSMLIAAPTRSYSPPDDEKRWGLFLPMYAAQSRESWGAGDLRDWQRLSDWARNAGAQIIGTLPLLAAFMDKPVCEPSPYSPASRLFWNEFYLDIDSLPEFDHCKPARALVESEKFQGELQRLRAASTVDYSAIDKLRRQVLEQLASYFFRNVSFRHRDFRRFMEERPAALDYAQFRATCEQTGTSWHNWEHRLKRGKLQKEDFSGECCNYHLYAQWQAERQFSAFIERFRDRAGMFYLDLPLGVHSDGYDIWRERDAFAFPASTGAPPDSFFTKGQSWGFAPLHPQRIRERQYQYVQEYLRFQMRHTGLLRIDHVMGLHRLYWIPPGFSATEGAYVTYPADELHAILSLESHRHKTVLVGENLGTVPPQVNEAMRVHNIRQIFVVQYEQTADAKRAVRTPPKAAVASVNTHDMPTFAAHWTGADLEDRVALGLIAKKELRKEKSKRQKLNDALACFLRRKRFISTDKPDAREALLGCLRFLAKSPAEMVQITVEDLWQELLPQNVPGTSTERPNWRRKARVTLEEITTSRELFQVLKEIGALRKAKG